MPRTRITFLDVSFSVTPHDELVAKIDSATSVSPLRIATPNPEFMLEAQENPAFRDALGWMTDCIVDGFGLFLALKFQAKLMHRQVVLEHLHGSDLTAELFSRYSHGEKSFYFLGGKPGDSQGAANELAKAYPDIAVAGASDGGKVDANNPIPSEAVLDDIRKSKPDILLVGFGAPKQELWIRKASEVLEVPVMIGVGGTLDFYTKKKRAPIWVRSFKLEWLYRSLNEPGHWKRAWRATVVFSLRSAAWIIGRQQSRPQR